jgi:hypothetical protein
LAEQLVRDARNRLADVLAMVAELESEAGSLKAWLAETLGDGTHVVDGRELVIFTPRRFSVKRAVAELAPVWIPQIMQPAINPALAKQILPAELYAQCQEPTRPVIRMK